LFRLLWYSKTFANVLLVSAVEGGAIIIEHPVYEVPSYQCQSLNPLSVLSFLCVFAVNRLITYMAIMFTSCVLECIAVSHC